MLHPCRTPTATCDGFHSTVSGFSVVNNLSLDQRHSLFQPTPLCAWCFPSPLGQAALGKSRGQVLSFAHPGLRKKAKKQKTRPDPEAFSGSKSKSLTSPGIIDLAQDLTFKSACTRPGTSSLWPSDSPRQRLRMKSARHCRRPRLCLMGSAWIADRYC